MATKKKTSEIETFGHKVLGYAVVTKETSDFVSNEYYLSKHPMANRWTHIPPQKVHRTVGYAKAQFNRMDIELQLLCMIQPVGACMPGIDMKEDMIKKAKINYRIAKERLSYDPNDPDHQGIFQSAGELLQRLQQ